MRDLAPPLIGDADHRGARNPLLQRDRLLDLVRIDALFVNHDIDESVYLGERVIVLSMSPTVVQEDLHIALPAERDQISTRSLPLFNELRTHVYEQIQKAKRASKASRGRAD